MRKLRAAIIGVGIFAGLGGATHGPGEILQGNVSPTAIMIKAWPQLAATALGGEPAITIIPNYIVPGILAIFFGILVTAWAGAYVERRMGGMILILLSIAMLLVGAGVVPPLFGVAAGIMGVVLNRRTGKQGVVGA